MENNTIEERSTAETFREYANLLWRWLWLLVLSALLAGGIAYWVSKKQTPIYEASALVMINAAPTSQTVSSSLLTAGEQLAATYSKLMLTTPVLDGVAKVLSLDHFPGTASVQAIADPNTQLMSVIVQDTDPARAALLANTLVQVFSDQIQADQASRYADSKKSLADQMASLEQQIQKTSDDLAAISGDTSNQAKLDQLQTALAQYRQSYASLLQSYEQLELAEAQSASGVIQKEPAVPPVSPIKPQPVRNALLAAVLGLMLAGGVLLLIEFLDDTIRDPQEITRKWGIPVLGMIFRYEYDKNALITAKQPRSPVSEAFRSIRTNLQFASISLPIKKIIVTSASPGDGKTTVAANLGSVIAQSGRSVVVVDADLRNPKIHKILQLSNRIGLTDHFIRPQTLYESTLNKTDVEGFQALTTGPLPPNPSELLGSKRMSEILHHLNSMFDIVILDTPPTTLVTDALVLAPNVDGVVVVIKPRVTKRGALKYMLDQLQQVKAKVIGVVLNDVQTNRSHSYYYYRYPKNGKYGKGYGYSEEISEPVKKQSMVIPERGRSKPLEVKGLKKND